MRFVFTLSLHANKNSQSVKLHAILTWGYWINSVAIGCKHKHSFSEAVCQAGWKCCFIILSFYSNKKLHSVKHYDIPAWRYWISCVAIGYERKHLFSEAACQTGWGCCFIIWPCHPNKKLHSVKQYIMLLSHRSKEQHFFSETVCQTGWGCCFIIVTLHSNKKLHSVRQYSTLTWGILYYVV